MLPTIEMLRQGLCMVGGPTSLRYESELRGTHTSPFSIMIWRGQVACHTKPSAKCGKGAFCSAVKSTT